MAYEFNDALRRWLDEYEWTIPDLVHALQESSHSCHRSTVNKWLNLKSDPRDETKNGILKVFGVTNWDMFLMGPHYWLNLPWPVAKVTCTTTRMSFKDRNWELMGQEPVDVGVIFITFLRACSRLMSASTKRGWAQIRGLGISDSDLAKAHNTLSIGQLLEIVTSINMDPCNLPLTRDACTIVQKHLKRCGWNRLEGGSLFSNFLFEQFESELSKEDGYAVWAVRNQSAEVSIEWLTSLSYPERKALAAQLTNVQMSLEDNLLVKVKELAIVCHRDFHLLLLPPKHDKLLHYESILAQSLVAPTIFSLEDDNMFLVAQQQHREVISLLGQNVLASSLQLPLRCWYRREHAFGLTGAVLAVSHRYFERAFNQPTIFLPH